MQFTLNKSEALPILSIAKELIEKKSTDSSFGYLKIQQISGVISVSCGNGENWFASILPTTDVQNQPDGVFLVNPKKFVDQVALNEKDLTVRLLDNGIFLTGNNRTRLPISGQLETFIDSPFVASGQVTHSVKTKQLQLALDRLVPVAGQMGATFGVDNVLFRFAPSGLELVTTDGNRLALTNCDLFTQWEGEEFDLVLPKTACKQIINLCKVSHEDDVAEFTKDSNGVQVEVGTMSYYTRSLSGRFPDYTRIFPDKTECSRVSFDGSSLLHALGRVLPFTDERSKGLKFMIEPGNFTVSTKGQMNGDSEETIGIQYEGTVYENGISGAYLGDFLKEVGDGNGVLYFNGSTIYELNIENDLRYRYCIAAMRV